MSLIHKYLCMGKSTEGRGAKVSWETVCPCSLGRRWLRMKGCLVCFRVRSEGHDMPIALLEHRSCPWSPDQVIGGRSALAFHSTPGHLQRSLGQTFALDLDFRRSRVDLF